MADLGTIRPAVSSKSVSPYTAFGDPGNGGYLNDDSDSTYVGANNNGTDTYAFAYAMGSTPSDFSSMDTLYVSLRYAWTASPNGNLTWNYLSARILTGDGATVLAAASGGVASTEVANNITDSSPTTSSAIQFVYVNTSASKTDWDGAYVELYIDITRSKGGDSGNEAAVFEAYFTGTYTQSGPAGSTISPSAIASSESVSSPTVVPGGVTIAVSGIVSGVTYDDLILSDVPTAFWILNDSAGYPQDASGNAHHVTAGTGTLGETSLLPGDSETASLLNGTSDYWQIPDGTWGEGDVVSVEVWLKLSSVPSGTNFHQIFRRGAGAIDLGYNGSTSGNTNGSFYLARSGDASQIAQTVASFADTNVHHVVITKNGSTYHIYVDGNDESLNDVGDSTCGTTTDAARIGAHQTGSQFWPGWVQKVAIYDYALTQAQVTEHYDAGQNGPVTGLGTPTLTNTTPPVYISPTGIASAEAIGAPVVQAGGHTAVVSGIASEEAIGSATVKPAGVTISPTGIEVPAGAFGTPTLTNVAPPLYISPSSIASAEAFGSATLSPGGVSVQPSSITTGEALGTPALGVGVSIIVPTAITSAESVGTPSLLHGSVSILAGAISSAETFGTASISAGPVSIQVTGIVSAEAIGSHLVEVSGGPRSVLVSAIDSAEGVGAPVLSAGPVAISVSGISSDEAFGTAELILSQVINSTSIDSTETFGTPVVVTGGVLVVPTGISSAEAFGSAFVSSGQLLLRPTGITSVEAFGSPTVLPGAWTCSATSIGSGEALGTPDVLAGTVQITPAGVSSGESLPSPVVSAGNVDIAPSGISTAEVLGSPILTIEDLSRLILAEGVASLEQFGTANLLPGNVYILPSGIESAEALGVPANANALATWQWSSQSGWRRTREGGWLPVQAGFRRTRKDHGES